MLNNAAEYGQWCTRILATPGSIDTTGDVMVTRAVIELLASDPFYGQLLSRIPRRSVATQTVPFNLVWRDNRLELTYSPQAVAKTFPRFDSLRAGLKHVALHVAWQHPLRYRQQVATQGRLVRLATDLAVNQYVDGLPAGVTSLQTVQPLVAQQLPIKADSGTYLQLLRQNQNAADKVTPSPDQPKPSSGSQPSRLPSGAGHDQVIDDPGGWGASAGQLTNPNLAATRLQQLTRDAWADTPEAGRGLVAGHVVSQLQLTRQPAMVDWRRLLVRGLGQLPTGKRASHARFNRRQPARMELPGQLSDLRLAIQVYVDHSGSISDATLQAMLSQVATLTQALPVTITVKAFDAVVQPGQTYHASLPNQIRFTRHGGGGTVFQSVFDDLAAHHWTDATTLALILTDGRGERTIDPHHFSHVIWLLAHPHDRLSVQPVVGRVAHLKIGVDQDG